MHPAIPGTRGLSESAVRLRSNSGGGASVMFPELAGHAELMIDPAVAAASAPRRQVRQPRQMSFAGMPSVALVEGLLRAPRRGRAPPPCLSAVACEVTPGRWPSRIATPGQVLADRSAMPGALLARAGAARQALLAARVGGAWWEIGDLPRTGDYALVVLAEPTVPEGEAEPAAEILAAMLDAALAENPANRLVIVAPGAAGDAAQHRLWPRLTAAVAAGATLIRQMPDPW